MDSQSGTGRMGEGGNRPAASTNLRPGRRSRFIFEMPSHLLIHGRAPFSQVALSSRSGCGKRWQLWQYCRANCSPRRMSEDTFVECFMLVAAVELVIPSRWANPCGRKPSKNCTIRIRIKRRLRPRRSEFDISAYEFQQVAFRTNSREFVRIQEPAAQARICTTREFGNPFEHLDWE